MRAWLALALTMMPVLAHAQQNASPPPEDCRQICPPCPPFGPCPPCATECTTAAITGSVVVPGTPDVVIAGPPDVAVSGPPTPPATERTPPVAPAPGTLELGYLGAFDGRNVMSGGGLRTTGHITDIWFVDIVLGGLGADLGGGHSLWELVGMLGVRAMGPVLPNILRLFAAVDVGITARGEGGYRGAPTWGAFAADAGGGLEVGFDSRFTAGFFVDARLQTRVPFEHEAAFVGFAWSAGLAILWF